MSQGRVPGWPPSLAAGAPEGDFGKVQVCLVSLGTGDASFELANQVVVLSFL